MWSYRGCVVESKEIERTMTILEAAAILGISRNAAYEAAKTGQIPIIRIGKRILVPRAALDRLLETGS
jgi:excisionase family DNA binding protein